MEGKVKKILIFSLVLALAVTLLLPSLALAASPDSFSARGVLTSIDTGNVNPEGDGSSGIWLVADRHIQGKFIPSVQGKSNKVNGDFTITYSGKFNILDQSGSFLGKLETKSALLSISGQTQPCTLVGSTQVPDGKGGFVTVPLYKLVITGNWVGVRSLKAEGDFSGYLVFIPDTQGHVVAIVDSSFAMNGDYSK
jgi:hypothetical protein